MAIIARVEPEEIHAFRKRLGLGQSAFAVAMGSLAARENRDRNVRRWEKGTLEPPTHLGLLMVACDMSPEFQAFLVEYAQHDPY